ncbi:MAG: dTMP kinase [Gammaproteobacteria bacterium]|jgi:dTMP kinase
MAENTNGFKQSNDNRMVVIDGVDGSGKGVQTCRLKQSFINADQQVILTREPGGSANAEQIRKLLVKGEPDKWDSMTELLLMYASRRAHLRDTIWPALNVGSWVICDRFADSSRAFQGIAGNLGLDLVEQIHQVVVGEFEPALVVVLDIPQQIALNRAKLRGDSEDRFEKKGEQYHARVRQAFLQIAAADEKLYRVINADQEMDKVTRDIIDVINERFQLTLIPVLDTF